jgi:two-component system, chemotaxis family, CheB/CheR fusion protein
MNDHHRIQIFATDIDETAIDSARAGIYPISIETDVGNERLKRFFIKTDGSYRINQEVRDSLIFAMHDIISDPPFTNLDMISCRNLLIYLNSDVQKKILPTFSYSLRDGGTLFLGPSESIGDSIDQFVTKSRKWRIFQNSKSGSFHVPLMPSNSFRMGSAVKKGVGTSPERLSREQRISNLIERNLLKRFTPPSVIINMEGDIQFFHGETHRYLLPAEGKATLNIIDMARRGLKMKLVAALRKAMKLKLEVRTENITIPSTGGPITVAVSIIPFPDTRSDGSMFMIVFDESIHPPSITDPEEPDQMISDDEKHLTDLESELIITRENLQNAIEDLQTSNEELRSSNEELHSTNEELQSTNEELETTKEEQQSLNEELITLNSELQVRIDQLSNTNDDLINLLENSRIPTVFLDSHLHLKRFSSSASDIINLITTDIGRPIGHISTNLVKTDITEISLEVLRDLIPKEIEVAAKGDIHYLMRIKPYRTITNQIDGVVVTFFDITEQKRLMLEVQDSKVLAQNILQTIQDPLVILDHHISVETANEMFFQTFDSSPESIIGSDFFSLSGGLWNDPELRTLLERILPHEEAITGFRIDHDLPPSGLRNFMIDARAVKSDSRLPQRILLVFHDITDSIDGSDKHGSDVPGPSDQGRG